MSLRTPLSALLLVGAVAAAGSADARPGQPPLKLVRPAHALAGFKRVSMGSGMSGMIGPAYFTNRNGYRVDIGTYRAFAATGQGERMGLYGPHGQYPNQNPGGGTKTATPTVTTTPKASTVAPTETPAQTTTRLNTIMAEMSHAGYSGLQIIGSGSNAAIRGVKELPGQRIESTICKPGMCGTP